VSAKAAAGTDGWELRKARRADLDALMGWFTERADVETWGGPEFRFPFTAQSFCEDMRWGQMESFCLSSPESALAAFGQIYLRDGRIHLARLVVNPRMRRLGVGSRLIERLMAAGRSIYRRDEYSLFVFRDNVAALRCYESLGFTISRYPADMPYADSCHFLVLPSQDER